MTVVAASDAQVRLLIFFFFLFFSPRLAKLLLFLVICIIFGSCSVLLLCSRFSCV